MPPQYGVLPASAPHFTGDKLSICRDYLTGQCGQSLCPLVHPGKLVYGLTEPGLGWLVSGCRGVPCFH